MSVKLSETTVIYGDRQTFTFGGAGGLQFQLYDKAAEAIKTDKIGFWESIWRNTPAFDPMEPEYQDGDDVKRIEMRFHHSIIKEFCNGTKDQNGDFITIKNFVDLSEHLTALWRYSLNNFRLQHSDRYIHPLWQFLIEDIEILKPSPNLMYMRKPKPSGGCTRRNVAFWLGNSLRLMSSKGFTVEHCVKHFMTSGLDSDLMDYFDLFGHGARDFLPEALYQFISAKFDRLLLEGNAA